MNLIISDLKKSFGKKQIFDGFSYTFNSTGIYALCGESGIGKTTLLRLIAGLDTDFSGTIENGGIGNVSVAFQDSRLFPNLSAIDNVILANFDSISDETKRRAEELLISLGLDKKDTTLFPSELSGGMKARVSLARAFLKDSPILLLDEPMKELDTLNKEKAYEIIKRESESRLVIMVTHSHEDIQKLSAKTIEL